MKNREIVNDWISRAESNLYRARAGLESDQIIYKDLCYDCQQAVEKSRKAF